MHYPVRVLFVCNRNSIRSQIAEALLRRIGRPHFQAFSAGIAPAPLDSLAVEMMNRRMHIDISGQISKSIEEFFGDEFDYVITLCARAEPYAADFSGECIHLRWRFPEIAELRSGAAAKRRIVYRLCLAMAERIRCWARKELVMLHAAGLMNSPSLATIYRGA